MSLWRTRSDASACIVPLHETTLSRMAVGHINHPNFELLRIRQLSRIHAICVRCALVSRLT